MNNKVMEAKVKREREEHVLKLEQIGAPQSLIEKAQVYWHRRAILDIDTIETFKEDMRTIRSEKLSTSDIILGLWMVGVVVFVVLLAI